MDEQLWEAVVFRKPLGLPDGINYINFINQMGNRARPQI